MTCFKQNSQVTYTNSNIFNMCFQCGFAIFSRDLFPTIQSHIAEFSHGEEAGELAVVNRLAEVLESNNFDRLCLSYSILQASILESLVCLGTFFRMMGAPFHLGTLKNPGIKSQNAPLLSNNFSKLSGVDICIKGF